MDALQRKMRSLISGSHPTPPVEQKSNRRRNMPHAHMPHSLSDSLGDAVCPVSGMRHEASPRHDLTEVRRRIEAVLHDPSHDDGSFAPLLIRFAWHICGTYNKESKNGGSNGATMRFDAEANDPENAGFEKAKAILAPIHEQFAWLSLADIWILAGYVAIEAVGGPRIRFAYGRKDFTKEQAIELYGKSGCPFGDGKFNPNGSRLPAADLGPDESVPKFAPMCMREAPTINAMRSTFTRMGFDDRETVALIILGHQFGRCHREVSGYEGAWWAKDPTTWNSEGMGFLYCAARFDWEYEENPCSHAKPMNPANRWPILMPANRLQGSSWTEAVRPHPILAQGVRQYDNTARGRHIMMLISDMCLTWDPEYRQHLQHYRNDRESFTSDAIAAWKKLTELGCDGMLVEEATPH